MTLLLLLLTVLPVELKPSVGDLIRGDLQTIDATGVIISTEGGPVQLPLDEVSRLDWPANESHSPSERSVLLRNDSLIPVIELGFDGDQLTVRSRRQEALQLKVDSVHAVRFHLPRPDVDAAWLGMLSEDSASDRLVIRRDGSTLDTADGVILEIDETSVKFEIDGDTVSAPIERLEGVIYGSVGGTTSTASDVIVRDTYGGRWVADSLSADSSLVRISVAGTRHSIAIEQIASITISGSVQTLANSETISSSWNLDIAPEIDWDLAQSFLVRREGDTIEFPAGTDVTYRVPEGFSRLVGSIGRAAEVVAGTPLTLTISGEDRELWRGVVETDNRSGFELELGGIRRVTIRVDAGNDGSLGDTVELSRVRFLK